MDFVLFLGILLLLGLGSTRIMKIVKLPNVTGYLIIGLVAAIVCIIVDNFSQSDVKFTLELTQLNSFISSIALGFIALSIGEEFRLTKLKEYGSKITLITFFQAITAVLFVDVALIIACLILKVNLSIAVCLGAIATATAPAATLMVINQYKAKGPIVDILLPVVAFDDAIGLMVFAISVSIAKVIAIGGNISFFSLLIMPLIEILGSLLIGLILGIIMHFSIKFFKSRNNHAITIIAFTLLGVGLCNLLSKININGEKLELSNLLTCMMIGAVYINLAREEKDRSIVYRDFDLIDHWTPFLFMLFFVLSGAHLAISANSIIQNSTSNLIITIIVIFLGYIIMRSLGKYLGAYTSCKITKQEKTITKYLGVTLLPQAGVAIGMANQISNMDVFKVDDIGNIIVTVVLCATLVYELIGPLLTKWSLTKAGEINCETSQLETKK